MRPLSSTTASEPTQRAATSIIGTLLVVALTLVVAATLSTAVLGGSSTPDPAPTAALELSVEGQTLTVTHTGGEPFDIETVSLEITVDGEPLAHQPPVPFFAASGFVDGTTGAFNPSGSTELAVGESASLTIAETNTPTLEAGSTVSITLYTDNSRVGEAETTV